MGQWSAAAESVGSSIDEVQTEATALDGQTAIIAIDADTTGFDSSMDAVGQRMESVQGQFAVNTESADGLRKAIRQLNETPTLDPFGDTRAKYEELIQFFAVKEKQAVLEKNQEIIAAKKQATEERLDLAKESYVAAEEAAQEAYDSQKIMIQEQIM